MPDILTVSAGNEYDQTKTPSSMDGESWWGTNHEQEVNFTAPGIHDLTTNIHGTDGYIGGDCQAPSSTAPRRPRQSSPGACALVLSANPNLSEAEVTALIEDDADQVPLLPVRQQSQQLLRQQQACRDHPAMKAAEAMLAIDRRAFDRAVSQWRRPEGLAGRRAAPGTTRPRRPWS